MSVRALAIFTGTFFFAAAGVHLARIIFGWGVTIGHWGFPHWLSWIVVAAGAYLGVAAFRIAHKEKTGR